MTLLITGGAGFIGSTLLRELLDTQDDLIVNVDNFSYAASPDSLTEIEGHPRYRCEREDIADAAAMRRVLETWNPRGILHLAAESHVDRSIDGPAPFIHTNVVGTFTLLSETLTWWRTLTPKAARAFRFLHVSTDEVYGSLGDSGYFTEASPYDPSSPYSASKAAADHLVRAWGRTYGLPVVVTNCSNNYGPRQFPEKLIPLTILNAVEGNALPVYGNGSNVRDWLHVLDHARALIRVFDFGRPGQTYVISGRSERRNLEVVHAICDAIDDLLPMDRHTPRRSLVRFVADRPGHDRRYAIDASRIENELGWRPTITFEEGLQDTVRWYLENRWWWEPIRDGVYRGERLGLGALR